MPPGRSLLCSAWLLHLKRVSESTRRVWENVTTEYKLDKDRKQKRGARGQMDKSREAMLAQMGDHLQKPKVSLLNIQNSKSKGMP